jgi:perosamine synthetase
VYVIEDCACAAGASYNGKSAGALGQLGVFSFHPRKSITTGEGGMITTDDDVLAEKINCLRNHGASISEEQRHLGPQPYLLPEFNLLGYNYRMTDLQGAVGLTQLNKLDRYIQERQEAGNYYRKALSDVKWLRCPETSSSGQDAWQSYVCYVDPASAPMPRNDIMDKLNQQGIGTRPGTHAVHTLGLYRNKYGLKPEDFPNAYACDRNTLAIPLHNKMSPEDYDYVIQAIKALTLIYAN